jgi:hypothetical protein
MLLVLGILLRLLTPTNLSAYKGNLQPFATIDFSQDVEYHYDSILEKLNLLTLHIRRRESDALFLINVFSGAKHRPSLLVTVGIRVPTWNVRYFTMLCCFSSHCPSVRCVFAANAVCKSTDIFINSGININNLSLFRFLCFYCCFFILCCLIAVAVCILAESVIGHWLLSSARK